MQASGLLKWQWLVVWHLLAGLLLSSWLMPITRELYDNLDRNAFYFLNGFLAIDDYRRDIFAFLSSKPFSSISQTFVLVLLLLWLRDKPMQLLRRCLIQFVLFAVFVLLCKEFVMLFIDWIDYHRQSPTYQFTDAYRLSELVHWVVAKDVSGRSFPSDHAYVSMMLMLFFWCQRSKGTALVAFLLGMLVLVPRLVSGAHWLTDMLVGSLAMTMVTMGWWCVWSGWWIGRSRHKIGSIP